VTEQLEALPVAPPTSDNGAVPAVGDARRARARPRRIALWLAAVWLVLVIGGAIFAGVLPLPNPTEYVGHGFNTAPFTSWGAILGTDEFGRSELARVIVGARYSLAISVSATVIALIVGLMLGIAAGYFRGATNSIVGALLDGLVAFPSLILLIALAAMLQPGITTLVIGLSLIATPAFARVARSYTLRARNSEYVLVAQGLGGHPLRIIWREIVPGAVVGLIAYSSSVVAILILAESSLSYLGVGIPPPTPTWGNMIAEGQPLLAEHPYPVLVPCAVLFLTIYAVNVVGEYARARQAA
jgi:peptide/nickel transport system permease protein